MPTELRQMSVVHRWRIVYTFSAVGGDFPGTPATTNGKKEDILTLRTFFSAILFVIKTREKKNLPFNPFRLLAAKKLRDLRTPCGDKRCRNK